MRDTITAIAVLAATLSLGTVPAGAHGALSETYTAVAPTPRPVHSSQGGCTTGTEDVHKDSHPFRWPTDGVLTAEVTNYQNDWDIGIVDEESGAILAYGGLTARFSTESVKASIPADRPVSIVACNYTGGPTATVNFSFVPKLKQSVSVGDAAVWEGDEGTRAAVFTVSLLKPAATTVKVAYATADASAGSPGDYHATQGVLSFAPGVTSMGVKVVVKGDTEQLETGEIGSPPAEGFRLVLSNPTGAKLGDAVGTGRIYDDDSGPSAGVLRLTAGDVSVTEGDQGSRNAVFTVSLSRPAPTTVTASYSTASGEPSDWWTATAPGDYLHREGTVSFAPGVTSVTVKVPVVGDKLAERDEGFGLALSNESGATVTSWGFAWIVDDV